MAGFEHIIKLNRVVLASFSAKWCEPCKILDEVLSDLKKKTGSQIFFHKVDVDLDKKIAEQHQVLSVPVLMLFIDENLVWRMNGFLLADDLIKTINKVFLSHGLPQLEI